MKNGTERTGSKRDQFGSRLGFILSAAGAAIGLGNLWRFPYMTGTNGGGAFVLVYLLCVVLLGASLLIAEFAIGRNGKANAIECYGKINRHFRFVGYWGMLGVFLLLAFYAIIGGWTIFYTYAAFTGKIIGQNSEGLGAIFGTFVSNPGQLVVYQIMFLAVTAYIVAKGISGGIEKYCNILMPGLFLMLAILAFRSLTLPGAMEGLVWYLKPDLSKISGSVVVSALGQAFFSLSLGCGGMVTYASYLNKKEKLSDISVSVALADTAAAVIAGLVIFPAVFAFGLEPGSGPGLLFVTLPQVFGQMPLGWLFADVFFVLLIVAALTSSIGMLEVVVTFVTEKTGTGRAKAAWLLTFLAFAAGIPPLMSFGSWGSFKLFGKNFFDLYDYFVSNITFPMVGLLGAVLVGYLWRKEAVYAEVTSDGLHRFKWFGIWYFIIKYLTPVAVSVIFLQAVGVLKL